MNCRIIWIDDEYKKQMDFIALAEQENIEIIPFESHEEGIKELEENLYKYHAVILDAKVKKMKDDTTIGIEGLAASRDRLIQINQEHFIPYFIFTGQPDYCSSEVFRESYGKFYIKGKDAENILTDIIAELKQSENYWIHKNYSKLFEACSNQYIGEESSTFFLSALKQIHYPKQTLNGQDNFNELRKIIERVFAVCNRYNLLPDEIYKGNGWINNSSKFLTGNHSLYKLNREILSPAIAFALKNTVQIIQDASHVEGDLKLKVIDHIENSKSLYLFHSSLFQIMEIVIFVKDLIDTNPQPNCWEKIEVQNSIFEGNIEQDEHGNYHCGDYLLNYRYTEENYQIGDSIQITETIPNSNDRTNSIYPHFAKAFSKKN